MQRRALVVGVSQYNKVSLGNFVSFANNANEIADILHPTFTVKRLPEAVDEDRVRVGNRGVTYDRLQSELIELFTATDLDMVLFYFSGHGLKGKQHFPKNYLAASDSEGLDDGYRRAFEIEDLKSLLKNCPAKEQIVWLDCCYGGDLANFAEVCDRNDGKTRFIITASRTQDPAYQEIAGEMGVFTRVLVEALARTGATERRITCAAIEDAVREKLQRLQYPQMPQFYRTPNKIIEFWDRLQANQLETSQSKPTNDFDIPSQPLSGRIINSENFFSQEDVLRDIIENIFLPELYFLRRPDAFPNADLPESVKNLSYGGSPISLILPIQSSFFQRTDAANLLSKLKCERLRAGTTLKLIMQVDGNLLEKEYELKNENAINCLPVAEIWPNFVHPEWKIYYGYSFLDIDDESFRVEFPNITNLLENVHTFGRSKISRFTNFPSHIICLYHDESVGIIPLKTSSPIKESEIEWNVGVCIGNSYTNVYAANRQYQTIAKLSFENLHYQITDSCSTTRIPALEECFIPLKQDLPIANLLTERGCRNRVGSKDTKAEVIFDTRIYAPQDLTQVLDRQNFLIGNLQWSSLNYRKPMGLFIEQLALQISAQAVKNGVTNIQWILSYPVTFSSKDKKSYVKTWNDCSNKLNNITGMKYENLSTRNDKQIQPERLAMIRFFNVTQEKTPNNTTCCIDIGGDSSEISIWETHNNVLTPILQCSIRLGVRHLFSDVIKRSPTFLRHIRFTNDEFTEVLVQLSKRNKSDLFYRALDAVLKAGSEDWLNDYRGDLEEDEPMRGYLQILAIGIAGLHYYIGIVLQVMHRADESNFSEHESGQPVNIYFGGNGSRLLNWLSYTGEFDDDEFGDLFQEMMIQASKLKPVAMTSVISSRPKDEVAYGLVVEESILTAQADIKEAIIAGEPCQIGVHRFEWDGYIEFNSEKFETNDALQAFDSVNLPQFLYWFHKRLRSKRDISISPVEGYSLGDKKRTNEENLANTFEDNLDLWDQVYEQLEDSLALDKVTIGSIHLNPPFILGLKALIEVLAKRWARKYDL